MQEFAAENDDEWGSAELFPELCVASLLKDKKECRSKVFGNQSLLKLLMFNEFCFESYFRLSKDYCRLYSWIPFSHLSPIFCLSSNVFDSNMPWLALICLQGVWSWRTAHEDAPWWWWMWIGQDLSSVHLVFFAVWYKDWQINQVPSFGGFRISSESPECWSKSCETLKFIRTVCIYLSNIWS